MWGFCVEHVGARHVEDVLAALDRPIERAVVEQIGGDELEPVVRARQRPQVSRRLFLARVADGAVHAVAAREEIAHDVRGNEAGSAGDEDRGLGDVGHGLSRGVAVGSN